MFPRTFFGSRNRPALLKTAEPLVFSLYSRFKPSPGLLFSLSLSSYPVRDTTLTRCIISDTVNTAAFSFIFRIRSPWLTQSVTFSKVPPSRLCGSEIMMHITKATRCHNNRNLLRLRHTSSSRKLFSAERSIPV